VHTPGRWSSASAGARATASTGAGWVYGTALAKALRGVEKLVPATALDRDTPLAAWCECRRVVRAAAEAAEGRAHNYAPRGTSAVGAASWEAVRSVLSGLLPACKATGELGERERSRRSSRRPWRGRW
jgi:hypothetical protein